MGTNGLRIRDETRWFRHGTTVKLMIRLEDLRQLLSNAYQMPLASRIGNFSGPSRYLDSVDYRIPHWARVRE